ncbi:MULTISPECIES: O-methyltransferase [Anaerococcus]|jgi:O-methyltransferase|uniref:tRNA 5-hydroxyuridine methyltransferase n=1 Tax=Anaerococcus octavius TaxID=54007 RepID=A0A2I1M9Z3_9FIRM|nr:MULTISPECIES: O-methyltransferase [Anaerococcus]MDU0894220.1 O-methyltransferase [Anaerococcus sp.]MDU3176332.1 O-methyltransferase [Anaerococcus sp.]MDU7411527.1 O-methyltransferase [Anaerococcus sp.]PKZ16956.1 O-methyltransferase [Anaerococcus octavius]SUU92279.1 Putative O-methyltransferase MSMEG_5073 [Anaerococcus octavius]
MKYINYPHTNLYLQNLIEDRDFLELREYALKENVPIMNVETKEFIKTILISKRPKSILEIGSAIGYSALVFDKYTDAEITTIELDEETANIARDNFSKYNAKINLINKDAQKALSDLNQGFDFVFIDANKSRYMDYFIETSKLLNDGGIIIADNVLFKGMVVNDDYVDKRMITIVKRLRNYLAYVMDRKDFQTTIIPIGDGLTLSIKE